MPRNSCYRTQLKAAGSHGVSASEQPGILSPSSPEAMVARSRAAGLGILRAVWLLDVLRAVRRQCAWLVESIDPAARVHVPWAWRPPRAEPCGLRFLRVSLRATRSASAHPTRPRPAVPRPFRLRAVVLLIQAALLTRTRRCSDRVRLLCRGGDGDACAAWSRPALGRTGAQFLNGSPWRLGRGRRGHGSPLPGGQARHSASSAIRGRLGSRTVASYQIVSPGYFSVLGIPCVRADFSPADNADAAPADHQ